MHCLLYPGALWQHSHQTNVPLATHLESLHSQRSGVSLKGSFQFFQESDLSWNVFTDFTDWFYRYDLRRKDLRMHPCVQYNPPFLRYQ